MAASVKLYKYRTGDAGDGGTTEPAPTDSGGTQPGGTTGSSTPPKLCQVNEGSIVALLRALYNAGRLDSPEIPEGHTVILRDGWRWVYTGSGWQAEQYWANFDMRDEPGFECG